MTRTRIVMAPAAPDQPMSYLVADADGHVLERGVAALARLDWPPLRTVLLVPSAEVLIRWLPLPIRDDRQARAAAALAIEDQLAVSEGDVHLALGPLESSGTRCVVAVARARLQGWLETCALHGLRPDIVVPDALALAPGDTAEVLVGKLGQTWIARGPQLAFGAEPDLAELLLEGQLVRHLAAGEETDLALAHGAAGAPLNLLQGAFDPARRFALGKRDFRRLAVLAMVLAVSPLLIIAAGALRDTVAARGVEQRSAAAARAALPGVTGDPARALEARLALARAAAGAGPAGLAASLFAAMETIEQGQVERLILMPDGSARATLSYTNFSDIELMRTALRQGGVTMREEGAREEGGRVISDIILGARG